MTLLVVSLEVPADYQALRSTLNSFLSFAVTFTVVIWNAHPPTHQAAWSLNVSRPLKG